MLLAVGLMTNKTVDLYRRVLASIGFTGLRCVLGDMEKAMVATVREEFDENVQVD